MSTSMVARSRCTGSSANATVKPRPRHAHAVIDGLQREYAAAHEHLTAVLALHCQLGRLLPRAAQYQAELEELDAAEDGSDRLGS
jgi:hypothetical protein